MCNISIFKDTVANASFIILLYLIALTFQLLVKLENILKKSEGSVVSGFSENIRSTSL